jgi:hypothetical protein
MINYLSIKLYVICLFLLALIFSFTEIDNANAKEYKPENSAELINTKHHNEKAQLAQLEKLERARNKEMKRQIGKKKDQLRLERARETKAKDQTFRKRFLEGGPTQLRVPLAPSQQSTNKNKKQPLRLPTWGSP